MTSGIVDDIPVGFVHSRAFENGPQVHVGSGVNLFAGLIQCNHTLPLAGYPH